MRKKMGWKVFGILGFVFAPMGFLFLMIGFLVGRDGSIHWRGNGDPVIFTAVFCGVGGLFLLLGLGFLAADIRRRYLLRRAYDGGNCVGINRSFDSSLSSHQLTRMTRMIRI